MVDRLADQERPKTTARTPRPKIRRPDRDVWTKWETPFWIGSCFVHLLLMLTARQMNLPPEEPPATASLETRLLELPEPIEPENVEAVLEMPAVADPDSRQEEVTLDVPTDSVASAQALDAPQAELAPLSPIDQPDESAISELLEGTNALAMSSQGLGGILNSRGRARKLGLLAAQGGSKETEDAVQWGLAWLARHQFADGHWSFDHTPLAKGPTSGAGGSRSMMGATGLGVLPFLASGYSHREGPAEYRKVVEGALRWIVQNQQPSGLLLSQGDGAIFYTHGLSAIALCEAFAMTKDPALRAPATAAVGFLLSTQNAAGGWRYVVGDGQCDTSVLGWQVMALKSATLAGIDVPDDAFQKSKAFLETVRVGQEGERFGYTVENDKVINVSNSTTSIGQLCMQFMGLPQSDPALVRSVDVMLSAPPTMESRDAYYWYYATQVLHNVQGSKWDRWNRTMKRVLTKSQNTDPKSTDHGSWDPLRPSRDRWGADQGGRHMVTCLHVLCLEVYYRYLPIYSVTKSEPPAPNE